MNIPTFTNPISGVELGDPFVLRHRGGFYLYGTNDGPPLPDGRVIPVFRSDDLLHWTPLGGALEPSEPGVDHWAPEVLAWNGRFYMVVSFGDVDRRGHELWVAVADRPEGPFRLASRLSDPSEKFSIDGAWLLDDDGRLYLFRCLDFVDVDGPHGTGIIAQAMRDPLTPLGPPATVLRAHSPWHLFEADRTMPLYEGRAFPAWTTIEGPAPVRRGGRYFCGYSGGNYQHAYGTGEAVADAPLGPYSDPRGRSGPIFGTTPGLVEGPGHFSVVRPDMVHDWIVLHGRRPGAPRREVWLCPAAWGPDGVEVGPLTDQPQPAPPLPTDRARFTAAEARFPDGWHVEGGAWAIGPDGLQQHEPGEALAWRADFNPGEAWVAEVAVRGTGGLAIGSGSARAVALIRPASPGICTLTGVDGPAIEVPLPTLGDEPFDPGAFHTLQIRGQAGRAEVRVDAVVVGRDLAIPGRPDRVGIIASGAAGFDAWAVTVE